MSNWIQNWINRGLWKANQRRQIQHIKTEIIEKLIDDAQDLVYKYSDGGTSVAGFDKELKSKWL